jgi:phosphatidylglycerophosphate synthase
VASGSDQHPWDQRIARRLVPALASAGVHPNAVTGVTALFALAAAAGFAAADPVLSGWAAGLFVLSRFLDHFDGELARATGRSSRLGYLLDYAAGGVSYAAVFAGIALGQYRGELGTYALVLGAMASACALFAVVVNLAIDRLCGTGDAVGYPSWAGFELEDGIYLLAPVTWLGGLGVFFIAACVGAVVYLAWSLLCLRRLRIAARRGSGRRGLLPRA